LLTTSSRSLDKQKWTVSLLLSALALLGLSLSGIPHVHASSSDPTIGPSPPLFFNPNCDTSLPATCNHPVWTTKNSRPALELTNTTGQIGTGLSGVAWHALGYTGTTADVSLDGTYTVTNGFLADGFTTILFAQNGTGTLSYMNNSIPGVSSPTSTGLPICGAVSSTGIQGGVVVPDSTKQYIALMWDPFYGSGPQFNLWVIAPPCTITANPGGIGCSIGIPAAGDTIRYDVNYTSTGNTLGAHVTDVTSGTNCSFTRGLTTDGFVTPASDIYWALVEGNRGAFAADWSLYSVTITPTAIFGCKEHDANGDFHGQGDFKGQNGQKENFNMNDDDCGVAVSSTNVGDGSSFMSTSTSSVSFNTLARTVTITGTGIHAGVPVTFTFVALETGPTTPGWVSFTFSDGYTTAGTLIDGSVQLN
jgi:hypothetical protein